MEIVTDPLPTRISLTEESHKIPIDLKDQPILKVENITVVRPTLLKIFYWEFLDIENLNRKLLSEEKCLEHHLELPARQLNNSSLKIVFWLRNLSNFEYVMRLKRVKNCQCIPKETRVGFNQYRNLYHCPHRRLIDIRQEMFVMKPNELLAMTIVSYYYILGNYTLSFKLRISDSRTVVLHFHTNISTFDATKSVLTTKMIPLNMREHRFMPQPLWIRNTTTQNISLRFAGKTRDFRLINPNLTIPPQSVWPLIVEYRPNDFENKLDLILQYGEKTSTKGLAEKFKIPITCKGVMEEEIESYYVPNFDYDCNDYLYVIYPNRLEFSTEINEERTLMVAVHNYDQKCMEFKWQTYVINNYFSFTFEPTKFTLKSHHSKLCVVRVKTFNRPLNFQRIPAVLEIHSIPDKSTKIAKQLLTEVESIDDPKWAESSYASHVFLHLDLRVKFPKQQRINLKDPVVKAPPAELANQDGITEMSNSKTTIFEKLFWDYLSKSNYMRNNAKIPKDLSYKQVLNQENSTKKETPSQIMEKQEALNLLSSLTAEACRDLAKNYRFVPREILDTI